MISQATFVFLRDRLLKWQRCSCNKIVRILVLTKQIFKHLSIYFLLGIKEIVHPKISILSTFTHFVFGRRKRIQVWSNLRVCELQKKKGWIPLGQKLSELGRNLHLYTNWLLPFRCHFFPFSSTVMESHTYTGISLADEEISVDKMWHNHCIQMCLFAFQPPYAAFFHLSDIAQIIYIIIFVIEQYSRNSHDFTWFLCIFYMCLNPEHI